MVVYKKVQREIPFTKKVHLLPVEGFIQFARTSHLAKAAAFLRSKMAAGRMAVLALAMQTMQAPGARAAAAGAVGAVAEARIRVHCGGGTSAFAFCRHDTVSSLWGALRGTGTRVMRRLGVTRSASILTNFRQTQPQAVVTAKII